MAGVGIDTTTVGQTSALTSAAYKSNSSLDKDAFVNV